MSRKQFLCDQRDEVELAQKRYKAFMDHRKMLHEALLATSGRFTQWVMTLSGGALALSITYVEKLHPETGAEGRGLLVTAWVCLCASLACSLVSLRFSSKETEKAIQNHDLIFNDWMADRDSQEQVNPNKKFNVGFSTAAVVLFCLGMLALASFVIFCPPSQPTNQQTHVSSKTAIKAECSNSPSTKPPDNSSGGKARNLQPASNTPSPTQEMRK